MGLDRWHSTCGYSKDPTGKRFIVMFGGRGDQESLFYDLRMKHTLMFSLDEWEWQEGTKVAFFNVFHAIGCTIPLVNLFFLIFYLHQIFFLISPIIFL